MLRETSPKVYARRLLKLAALLETVPRKQFDYTRWVGEDWEGKLDLSCGTVACAAGWATTLPEFRRLGLRLKYNDEGGYLVGRGREDDLAVLGRVFGPEATFLFYPGSGYEEPATAMPPKGWVLATPKQVARRIRAFVKRHHGMVE